VPEPAYKESQELEIACLVSTYDSPDDNNDAADSLLDPPSDLIYMTWPEISLGLIIGCSIINIKTHEEKDRRGQTRTIRKYDPGAT
jgi:hypothetical protein